MEVEFTVAYYVINFKSVVLLLFILLFYLKGNYIVYMFIQRVIHKLFSVGLYLQV